MMKLIRSQNPVFPLQNHRFLSAISTAASLPNEARSSSEYLFTRLTCQVYRGVSIVPILEKWVDEGRAVQKTNLQGIIKKLRKMKRYAHALEVSTWMSDRRYFTLSAGDLANRLELIYKLRGLEHAENYFNNFPIQNKVLQTYGALLKCYSEEKSVNKAEALFETMKELKLLTPFPYNILMSLYSCTGQHEKVEIVFNEMKEKGIVPDAFTDGILLNAYATALNIPKMEEVLRMIKQKHAVDFHKYAVVARAYLKAGTKDKALDKLRMAEKLIPKRNSRYAWGFLVTLYAEIENKDEMYRIWNAHKSLIETPSNSMYICMMSGLLKLDDVDGAEALFREWKSNFTSFDIRIPRLLISAYCKKGILSKAEYYVNEAVQSGEMLSSTTWGELADAYFEVNKIPKAVEMMKGVEAGKTWWKPSPENVNASLKYFEEQKDVEAAEEFVTLVRRLIPLTREVYECLLRIYFVAGKPVSGVVERMKVDNFDVDEETGKIFMLTQPTN